MITAQLHSIRPKYSNNKIYKIHSLFLVLQDLETRKPTQKFPILWWKASNVFIHLENALQQSWIAGWLGVLMRFVFYVALACTHFRRTL
jgi:hypothetical protein